MKTSSRHHVARFLTVPARIYFSGLLRVETPRDEGLARLFRAPTFRHRRSAFDQHSRESAKIPAISQGIKRYREYRPFWKLLGRNALLRHLGSGSHFNAPLEWFAVLQDFYSIIIDDVKKHLNVVGARNVSRQLACHDFRFRLIIHCERMVRERRRCDDTQQNNSKHRSS